MRRRILPLLLPLLALFAGGVARADTYGDANLAYQRGDYARAIELYEGLVAGGGESENLFYNLGNAHFRAGAMGPAIFNFERALRVAPNMEDANYNLNLAREVVAADVPDRLKEAETEPTWVFLASYFSISELTLAFLCGNFFFFAALIALRFVDVGIARTTIAVLAVFLAIFTASSALALNRQLYLFRHVRTAVVVADDAVMREGPDKSLAERLELHPGLKTRVIDERGDWVLIRLKNGVEGWLPREKVGIL